MAKKLNVRRSEGGKKIPTGVKAVSILFYIGAILCVIMAISMIFGANTIITSMLASNPGMGLESIPQGMMITVIIVIGILAVGAGVFSFFIGRGLWKLKQWARITAIVLSIVGFLSVIISIVLHFQLTQILSFVIDGFIGGYLLFNKEAKEAFK
jgi:hypothetical protein